MAATVTTSTAIALTPIRIHAPEARRDILKMIRDLTAEIRAEGAAEKKFPRIPDCQPQSYCSKSPTRL